MGTERSIALGALAFMMVAGCSGSDRSDASDLSVLDAVGPPDFGPGPPDLAPDASADAGDAGVDASDADLDLGPEDLGPADLGDAPPRELNLEGRAIGMGDHLAQTQTPVGQVSIVALSVDPVEATVSNNDGTGSYTMRLPANGSTVLFANKAGYHPTYTPLQLSTVNVQNQRALIAERPWFQEIEAAYGVDAADFACHPPLDTNERCVWSAIVGHILDDGAENDGQIAPVAGLSASDFTITSEGDMRYFEGPHFLSAMGTSSNATSSTVTQGVGGLFVLFVEMPVNGPAQRGVEFSATRGAERFGPTSALAHTTRGPNMAITWVELRETGLQRAPQTSIDFRTGVYPLFLPVSRGGFGCHGCHTSAGGAPAGEMTLLPQAMAARELDPDVFPARVNTADPASSLLLSKASFGTGDGHPNFAFSSSAELAFQIVETWIAEGALNTNNRPMVSFSADVIPMLTQPGAQGAGCYDCHVDVEEQNAPGGFYLGGDAMSIHNEITGEVPTDNGETGENFRISKDPTRAEQSLLLLNSIASTEPHPAKVFANTADPRYQLIYRWIIEGYRNN